MIFANFVNQFVDATGKPWPKVSVDGGIPKDYTHVQCGDAVASSAFNFATGKPIDPTLIRQKSGHASNRDGLTAREVATTLTSLGVPANVRVVPVDRLREVMKQDNAFVCLLVDDDTFNGCDPSYMGDHYIGLQSGVTKVNDKGVKLWAAWDPTCPRKADQDGLPGGVNWEDSANIIKAARKWTMTHGHSGVAYVIVRREAQTPPPVDPRDALIVKLKAQVQHLEDEIDGYQTAIDAAAKALEPFA